MGSIPPVAATTSRSSSSRSRAAMRKPPSAPAACIRAITRPRLTTPHSRSGSIRKRSQMQSTSSRNPGPSARGARQSRSMSKSSTRQPSAPAKATSSRPSPRVYASSTDARKNGSFRARCASVSSGSVMVVASSLRPFHDAVLHLLHLARPVPRRPPLPSQSPRRWRASLFSPSPIIRSTCRSHGSQASSMLSNKRSRNASSSSRSSCSEGSFSLPDKFPSSSSFSTAFHEIRKRLRQYSFCKRLSRSRRAAIRR